MHNAYFLYRTSAAWIENLASAVFNYLYSAADRVKYKLHGLRPFPIPNCFPLSAVIPTFRRDDLRSISTSQEGSLFIALSNERLLLSTDHISTPTDNPVILDRFKDQSTTAVLFYTPRSGRLFDLSESLMCCRSQSSETGSGDMMSDRIWTVHRKHLLSACKHLFWKIKDTSIPFGPNLSPSTVCNDLRSSSGYRQSIQFRAIAGLQVHQVSGAPVILSDLYPATFRTSRFCTVPRIPAIFIFPASRFPLMFLSLFAIIIT